MNKRQANKRRLAQALTQYQTSVLPAKPAKPVDNYSDALAVASAAGRAYVLPDGTGGRRHSGIVDATGVTNLTSATRSGRVYALHALNIQGPVLGKKINTGSRSYSEAKFTDWRWNMSIQESADFGIGGRYTLPPLTESEKSARKSDIDDIVGDDWESIESGDWYKV